MSASSAPAEGAEVAAASRQVATWTAVSRITGFLRVAAIAAVLGPTWIANIFNLANELPWIVYDLLLGSLLATLFVPPLVASLERRDPRATDRLAGAFLGLVIAAFLAVAAVVALLAPVLASLATTGVESSVASQARTAALVLFLLTAPQLIGYAVIAVAVSVQNAHGRFALPSALPTVENVIVLVTIAVYAVGFGADGRALEQIGTAELVVLGGGSTVAVLVHVVAQWVGASRVGVRLRPRWEPRSHEVREVLRIARPSVGLAIFNGARILVLYFVAATIEGGVVAIQFAASVANLPVALVARPVGVALLRQLSLMSGSSTPQAMRGEYTQGRRLALFALVPATAGLAALAYPLSRAAAFGAMDTDLGRLVLLIALAGMAATVLGEGVTQVALHSSYAIRDASAPFRAALVRFAVASAGLASALTFSGNARLAVAVASVAAADLVAGALVDRSVAAALGPQRAWSRLADRQRLLEMALYTAVVCVPVAVAGRLAPAPLLRLGPAQVFVVLLGAVALGAYIWLQRGSQELQLLLDRNTQKVADAAGARERHRKAPRRRRPHATPARSGPLTPARVLSLSVVVGIAVGLGGLIGAAAVAAALTLLVLVLEPRLGPLLIVGLTPFIVGAPRGGYVPLLRLGEALLAVVVLAAVLRWFLIDRTPLTIRLTRSDKVVAAVVVAGSIYPLLMQYGRLKDLVFDDVLYGATIVRLGLVYLVMRLSVRTGDDLRRVLHVSLGAAAVVGVIAVADSLNLAGAAYYLADYFPTGEPIVDDGRGAATISNPIGLSVYCAINLVVGLALWARGLGDRRLIVAGVVGCVLGVLGSGQITGVVALGVAVLAFGLVTGQLAMTARRLIPVALVALVFLWPLVAQRLEGFEGQAISSAALADIRDLEGRAQLSAIEEIAPGSSWDVRIANLRTHFLPEFDHAPNIIWGVRPQARVQAPGLPPGEFIWIESGYLWLVWTGGIPLLVAFVAWVAVSTQTFWRAARSTTAESAAVTAAAFAAVVTIAVVQAFDPHLTLRGSADALFPLIAMAATAAQLARGSNFSPASERRVHDHAR